MLKKAFQQGKRTISCSFVVILLFYCSLFGQSIFSFSAQGGPLLTGNSHMSALGFADVPATFSSNICGSIAFLKNASVDVTYSGTRLDMKDNSGKNTAYYYGFPFLKIGSTLPANMAVGIQLRKTMDFNANFVTNIDSINSVPFAEKFSKNGQLSTGTIELAKRISSSLGVGIGLDVLFGGSNEVWITNFTDTLFRDTQDSLKNNYFGYSYSFGIAYTKPWLAVGLGYDMHLSCDKVTRSLSYYRKDTTVSTDRLVFPGQFTGAMDLSLNKNFNVLLTLRYSNWNSFKYNGLTKEGYSNVFSYSFGIQYKNASGYKQRSLPLRIGYFSNPWYFKDSKGDDILEKGITTGTSIPILQRGGSLDLSFCGGMRKTEQLQEFFYKVNLGFNFQERW